MKNAHVSTTGYDCINETDCQRRSPSKFISCTAQIDFAVRAFQLLAFVHISCKKTIFRYHEIGCLKAVFRGGEGLSHVKTAFCHEKIAGHPHPKKLPCPWSAERNHGISDNYMVRLKTITTSIVEIVRNRLFLTQICDSGSH